MAAGRPVVFDTCIYIQAIREGLGGPAFEVLHDRLPRTYLSSVVAAELRAGATTRSARHALSDFVVHAHRVSRVVTPGAAGWERAGDVLGRMRERESHLRSKIARLWNDVLIAISARQVGAVLVTEDVADFEIIRRYLRFDLEPFRVA